MSLFWGIVYTAVMTLARLAEEVGDMTKFAEYWKFWVASLAPLFLLVQGVTTEGGVSQQELVAIIVAAGVAVGVLLKGNAPYTGGRDNTDA